MKIKNELKNKKGITLIALVITIIVLLILAGVTIATLTGNNGIITRANQAKEETEEAEDIEKIRLAISEAQIGENSYQKINQNNLQEAINSQFKGRDVVVSDNGDGTFTVNCLDTLIDYIISGSSVEKGIDWNEAMANAVAPASQDEERNEGVIGIGTDGKSVDMDLWEFSFLEDGTYGLNDSDVYTSTPVETTGYLGGYTDDGKIIGTIPQYIRDNNGNNFIPVTSLCFTFKKCDGLTKIPVIPPTVTDMRYSFQFCDGIIEVDSLPSSVTLAEGIFQSCNNLLTVKNLPDSITTLRGAFANCSNLKEIDYLPNSVVDLASTFANCINLENPPVITENVKNFINTFAGCINLHGLLEINANLSEEINGVKAYNSCLFNACQTEGLSLKIIGKSPNIEAIIQENQNPNITT